MNKKITFVDLFAGIGGFRLGLEKENYKCVKSCENDPHACNMYRLNFNDNPSCDITKLDPKTLPDFDVLCAGFPCQAFSICGQRKGFYDETRGTLFFDICRILEEKKPLAFILENVKNLVTHDKGKTMKVMLDSLESLGYTVSYKILNARDFNVPQNRERIILIGSLEGKIFNFDKLKTNRIESMKNFLDKEGNFTYLDSSEYTLLEDYKKQKKSGLIFIGYRNKKIRTKGVRPNTEHLSRVHKQPNRIYSSEGTHPTIPSTEISGRYWIYDDNKVRKLTINECYRFFGFPEDFKKVGSKSELYRRIGNSVCINMIQEIGKELKNQFFNEDESMINVDEPTKFLEKIYQKSKNISNLNELNLNENQQKWIKTVVRYEETMKGVFTVLSTSLAYKCLHPSQDVRIHQKGMPNGYSGRTFDTKYVTPFLKIKRFDGAMKESGWLTRSLEQDAIYDLNFPGKIRIKPLKSSFLNILNDVEVNNVDPETYLKALWSTSIIEKNKKIVTLVNPITPESQCTIDDIMEYLHQHFYYKYKSRGASILPVIALYSIYEILIDELSRFKDKKLDNLGSHHSCDRSSGNAGDIDILDSNNELYEVVEVKFDIPIDCLMVRDCYEKIKPTNIQRYYILSTEAITENDKINEYIDKIKKEHGCQIILNGVFPSIKYYLRLIKNTDTFMEKYLKNLNEHPEINYEHKISWNKIVSQE